MKILAIIFAFLAWFVYARSIIKKETIPSQDAILIYALATGVTFYSSVFLGAQDSTALLLAFAIFNVIGFGLALKYGTNKWCLYDKISISIVLISIILFFITSNAWISLITNVAIDVIGTTIIINKLWKQPGTESGLSWLLSSFSYFLNILNINQWVLQEYLFSLCNVILCFVVFTLTFRQPNMKAISNSYP